MFELASSSSRASPISRCLPCASVFTETRSKSPRRPRIEYWKQSARSTCISKFAEAPLRMHVEISGTIMHAGTQSESHRLVGGHTRASAPRRHWATRYICVAAIPFSDTHPMKVHRGIASQPRCAKHRRTTSGRWVHTAHRLDCHIVARRRGGDLSFGAGVARTPAGAWRPPVGSSIVRAWAVFGAGVVTVPAGRG